MVHRRRRKKVDVIEDCRGGLTARGFTLLQTWRFPARFGHSSEPVSIQECAARLRCSPGTILNALERGAPPPPRGGGARRSTTPTAKRKLMARRRQEVRKLASKVTTERRPNCDRVIRRVPFASSRKIAAELKRSHPQIVGSSRSNVARDLDAIGFVSRVRPVNPPTKDGDEEARLAFARACLKRRAQLCKIHFSDEKYFNTDDHTHRRQYVKREGGRALPRHRIQGAPSVLVWCALGVDYRRLVIYKEPRIVAGPRGRKPTKDPKKVKAYNKKKAKSEASKAAAKAARRVNAAVYCKKILEPYLAHLKKKNKRDVEFMQDGASAHTSLMAKGLLAKNGVRAMAWPARSCDLNPVENFWKLLQERVSALSPTTPAELRQAIRKCFDEFPQSEINNLVLSFESRCVKVVAAGGRHIRP